MRGANLVRGQTLALIPPALQSRGRGELGEVPGTHAAQSESKRGASAGVQRSAGLIRRESRRLHRMASESQRASAQIAVSNARLAGYGRSSHESLSGKGVAEFCPSDVQPAKPLLNSAPFVPNTAPLLLLLHRHFLLRCHDWR